MIVLLRKEQSSMVPEASQDQSTTCRLLALPAEVRNHIWNYLLVQNRKPLLPEHHYPAVVGSVTRRNRFCPNVLRTCKQINFEGTPILYGANVFSAHPSLLATLPAFLLIMSPNRVTLPPVTESRVMKLIRRYFIFVRLDTDPRYTMTQVEDSFNGVDELHIEVFQAMYGGCDFSVLSLFEGVRGVGRVKIVGSLGDRRYANWLEQTMQLPLGQEMSPFSEKYIGGMQAWSAWHQGKR